MTYIQILDMIARGMFGSPNSLLIEKRRNEWPQVAPAMRQALKEIRMSRRALRDICTMDIISGEIARKTLAYLGLPLQETDDEWQGIIEEEQ